MSKKESINAEQFTNKEDLIRKMDMTRYCRINAYKRCKEWDSFFNVILFVYNLIMISLSIIVLFIKGDTNLYFSIALIVFSVCTFAIDLFMGVNDYSSLAEKYKNSYNKIEHLIYELKCKAENKEQIESVYKNYLDHISSSINHEEIDYLRLCEEYPDNYMDTNKEIAAQKHKKYATVCFRNFMLKVILTFTAYLFIAIVSRGLSCVYAWFRRNKYGRDGKRKNNTDIK